MTLAKRVALALGIVLLDTVVFFLPLSALFLAYVLIFNPRWFRDFLNNLPNSKREAGAGKLAKS